MLCVHTSFALEAGNSSSLAVLFVLVLKQGFRRREEGRRGARKESGVERVMVGARVKQGHSKANLGPQERRGVGAQLLLTGSGGWQQVLLRKRASPHRPNLTCPYFLDTVSDIMAAEVLKNTGYVQCLGGTHK